MASVVCGRCENRHVIETLGAQVFLDALRSDLTRETTAVAGESSLHILRAQNTRTRTPLALPAPAPVLDVVQQLLRTHTEQER